MLFVALIFAGLFPQIDGHSLVEGNYRFSPLGQFDNGYPETKYEKVMSLVKEVYEPIIANRGGELRILSDWTDGAVNMWAWRLGKEYWLEVPGGMSRYHLINEEAFLVSLCHELGHLLGGQPQSGEISFEGQADFYATQNCIRLLLDKITPFKPVDPDLAIRELCMEEVNPSECERALTGSQSLSSYYAELEGVAFPQVDTPSSVVVTATLQKHPPAQCRLDTFVRGYFFQERPQCWFQP